MVRDRVKFRVGRIVYASISPDESDERYNWVRAWLAALGRAEMRELVIDAWRMVVSKRAAALTWTGHCQLAAATPAPGRVEQRACGQ